MHLLFMGNIFYLFFPSTKNLLLGDWIKTTKLKRPQFELRVKQKLQLLANKNTVYNPIFGISVSLCVPICG